MAMKLLSREERGERVRLVRKYAAGLSGRGLADAMGSSDPGLAARLEAGRGLSYERMVEIANACAGKGMLRKTPPEEILAFLEGRIDELHVVLDGQFNQMS